MPKLLKEERREVITVTDLKAEKSMIMSNLLLLALVGLTGYTSAQISSINEKVGSIDTTTQLNGQAITRIKEDFDRHELADNKIFDEIKLFMRHSK